ncbi:aminotransferase class V-fold PLP-dependent enzyme [Sphaerisporangium rubeum]|uniref:Selenocysteine lyase/cysteine desulfurase n=1 Tax=Sphaerisporangium rubeum TaxID=321317 RepID=A0A7X0M451_9ACTN|nr:aminotransferase class V-fold PLP-dependent enzyme [Sphaerisporangium rubeum]MBB6470915.1 selenocysteine lyase/cysteine desulfurase [Sphaerisporangium rubeum]
MTLSRRAVVAGLGALATGRPVGPPVPAPPAPPAPPRGVTPERLAEDESYWGAVARRFDVEEEFLNLENGYYGVMPEPVRLAYHRNVDRLNRQNSYLLRTSYRAEADEVRRRVAEVLGAAPEEIALTRGGTEALQYLITGYNRLRPGDTVTYADLDYHSAQYAMNWLQERRGVRVRRVTIPEPATRQAVLDTYDQALRTDPAPRLLLLSHMNNRTGLVTPVRDIVAMARARNTDVIVDAAHSFGHLDFTVDDLDADFGVFSLHKWIGAPLGSGFLHIRRHRLPDIDVAYADETFPRDDIRSRVHSGTMDVAPILTTGAALDFHTTLGAANKQARLRHLRDLWVTRAHAIGGIEILTPDDPAMYGAITAFRLTGRTTKADNTAVTDHLLTHHQIFTVQRGGLTGGDCVRVTPALFTSRTDMDRLATALRDVTRRIPPLRRTR